MPHDSRAFHCVPVNASPRLALRFKQLPLVLWWRDTCRMALEGEWIDESINDISTANEASRVIPVLNSHVQVPLTILIAKHVGINSPGEQAAGQVLTAIGEWSFRAVGHRYADASSKLAGMHCIVEQELTIMHRHLWSPVAAIWLPEGRHGLANLSPLNQVGAGQDGKDP